MKNQFTLGTLLFALFLATQVAGAEQAAKPAADTPQELSIVVVDSLSRGSGGYNAFNRIDRVFTNIFEKQKWPLKIAVERFASNTPAHEIELRIFYQGIFEEKFSDMTFHAWMTLTEHGKKHDFGVVKFSYYPHPGQRMEDIIDIVVRGAAELAVEKVGDVLFPKEEKKKP